ncbi:hypothetical protein BH11ARM1_BH11ARM1_00930 [soil metagenome]
MSTESFSHSPCFVFRFVVKNGHSHAAMDQRNKYVLKILSLISSRNKHLETDRRLSPWPLHKDEVGEGNEKKDAVKGADDKRHAPTFPQKSLRARAADVAYRVYCFFIIFSIVGTVATHILKVDPGFIAPLSGFCLVLSGALVVVDEVGSWSAAIFLAAVAAIAEVLGIFTGFPFGRYQYTTAWWPTISLGSHNFPLLLPAAWVLIGAGSWTFVRYWLSGWSAVLVAALLATLIDWPMERAMVDVFRYWRWETDTVPISNAIGWFGTAFLALAPFARQGFQPSGRASRALGLFCLFLAISGVLSFPSVDWIILAIYSVVLFLTPTVFRPENQNSSLA